MARVTVDDCLTDDNNNRFELIMLASRRARQLQQGAQAFVPLDKDKPTVLALREIAEGQIDLSKLDQIDEERKMAAVQEEIAEAAAATSVGF